MLVNGHDHKKVGHIVNLMNVDPALQHGGSTFIGFLMWARLYHNYNVGTSFLLIVNTDPPLKIIMWYPPLEIRTWGYIYRIYNVGPHS